MPETPEDEKVKTKGGEAPDADKAADSLPPKTDQSPKEREQE